MIEFKNVSLSFGSHTVFEDLNFKANFHERVAVIGGSGSGKTTILRLVLGLARPNGGDILIDGRSITDLPESQLRPFRMKFNIVFQEGALFDSMPVRENVAFCLREFSRLTETQIEQKVRTLLESLGIEEAIDLMPEELSGGMRRRVAIARSLAECEPKMFLYDEPTTGLDPIAADGICELIKQLSEGRPPDRKGFFLVTHRVPDAQEVADRFIYLRNQKIAFDGDLQALKDTQDSQLRRFIREILS
jgi:phospholipid/cholesterol/gamma-HCH transport system ATP-binding protein